MPRKKRHASRNKRIPAYEGYRPAIVTTAEAFVRRGRTYQLVVRGKQQKYIDPADVAAIAIMLGRQLKQEADDQDQSKPSKDSSEDSVETAPL